TTKQDRQFIIKNFHDLLARSDAAQHGFAERLFFYAPDEIFGDLKIDIGFEQRKSDLPKRSVDVLFADFSVTAEIFENLLQFIAKLRKHGIIANWALLFRRCRRSSRWRRAAFFDPESPVRLNFLITGLRAQNYRAAFLAQFLC